METKPSLLESKPLEQGVTRREFLKTAVASATGVALTVSQPRVAAPAVLKGTTLHLLQWSNFIAEADVEFKRQASEWGTQMGVKVTVENINMNDILTRAAAAVETGTGPDIIQMIRNWPHLYANGCVDVDDLAGEVSQSYGGLYPSFKDYCMVSGRYKAVPYQAVTGLHAYREDWFAEVGADKFPDTWEEYHQVGKKLKENGHPIGQSLGHTLGDAPGFCYDLLWAFGAKEVEEDGKTVAINSPEALQALEFALAFWNNAVDEAGLSWDDTSNNRAFFAEQISATLNGPSIYLVAKKDYPELARKINHGRSPLGPAGRFTGILTFEHAIMKYSKNQEAAREFIRFIMTKENYYKWLDVGQGYDMGPGPDQENHPLWQRDPKMLGFRDAGRNGRSVGYAGPPSRAASEAIAKYILVDLFAKVIQGESPKKALAWAETELRDIYGRV
jgi:multiple sugar transport system substrate-binding protein